MLRCLGLFSAFFVMPASAHAHLGHVGELAGHAHWIGLGATVVAGAIAIAVGSLADKETEDETDEDSIAGEEASAEG
jgi:hypothetical protein